jgi:hypothetical protein
LKSRFKEVDHHVTIPAHRSLKWELSTQFYRLSRLI